MGQPDRHPAGRHHRGPVPLPDRRRLRGAGLPRRRHRRSTAPPIGTAETDDEGWAFDGFVRTTGAEVQTFFNAYVSENRQYDGYDESLKTAYNFGFANTEPGLRRDLPVHAGHAGLVLERRVHRQQRRRAPGRGPAAAGGRAPAVLALEGRDAACATASCPTTRRSASSATKTITLHKDGVARHHRLEAGGARPSTTPRPGGSTATSTAPPARTRAATSPAGTASTCRRPARRSRVFQTVEERHHARSGWRRSADPHDQHDRDRSTGRRRRETVGGVRRFGSRPGGPVVSCRALLTPGLPRPRPTPHWWRQAVVYQVYPRSFADASGDGIGDVRGITSRADYLAALGVDAVWVSPFYPSALADGGYDVDDYRDVDPVLGTLEDFDELVAALHARGVRVIVDIVPEPLLGPARVVPRRAGGGPRVPRARALRLPRRHRPRRLGAAQRLGVGLRRTGLGARARRPVVPPHVRPRAARLQLGPPGGPRGLPRARCASGPTAASTASASTSRTRWSRTSASRSPPPPSCRRSRRRWAATRCGTRTASTRCTPSGGACSTSTTRPARPWPRRGSTAAGWRRTPTRRAWARPSPSTCSTPPGTRRPSARSSPTCSTATTTRARRRRGCSPTTTWCATPRATGSPRATGPRSPRPGWAPTARTRRWTARPVCAGPAPPPSSCSRCRARRTSTRARSSASTRSPTCRPRRCRTRPGSASGHTVKGRDGCRVPIPWTTDGPSYGFGDGSRRTCRSRAGSARSAWPPRRATRRSTLTLYREALRLRHDLQGAEELTWHSEPGAAVLDLERPGGWRCVTNMGDATVDLPDGRGAADQRPARGRAAPRRHLGLAARLTGRQRSPHASGTGSGTSPAAGRSSAARWRPRFHASQSSSAATLPGQGAGPVVPGHVGQHRYGVVGEALQVGPVDLAGLGVPVEVVLGDPRVGVERGQAEQQHGRRSAAPRAAANAPAAPHRRPSRRGRAARASPRRRRRAAGAG